MREYQDGHFEPPEPAEDALQKALENLEDLKAIHFGTERELTRQYRRMMKRKNKD